MISQKILTVAIVVLVASVSFAQQPGEVSFRDESTLWVGGIGSLEDENLNWQSATLQLENVNDQVLATTDGDFEGKLKSGNNRTYSASIIREGENVIVNLRRRRLEREFVGRIQNGVLDAKAKDDQTPNRIILRQSNRLSATDISELSGMYIFPNGQRMSIRSNVVGIGMTNYETGKVRRLYSVERDKFVAGSAMAIPDPIESNFDVVRNNRGTVTGFRVHDVVTDQTTVASKRPEIRISEFTFNSFDETQISGSLFQPAGTGPFPAVVWVHGSGKTTRTGAGSWPYYFCDLGYSVLAVDKRGMGKSEGNYHLPGGGRDNFPHMRRRSKDVAAAVSALAKRPDIQPDRIGLVGGSQAGWVIPMTVGKADIAFAVIVSGGATPLSIEGRYSRLAAENKSGSSLPPVKDLIKQLREYEPMDKGIDSELSQLDYPCLWLYGLKDRSNPSQICVERINGIGQHHQRDFTVKVFPYGNHGLLVCRFGGSAEYRALDRLVPGLHQTIESWLSEKQLLPKQQIK